MTTTPDRFPEPATLGLDGLRLTDLRCSLRVPCLEAPDDCVPKPHTTHRCGYLTGHEGDCALLDWDEAVAAAAYEQRTAGQLARLAEEKAALARAASQEATRLELQAHNTFRAVRGWVDLVIASNGDAWHND